MAQNTQAMSSSSCDTLFGIILQPYAVAFVNILLGTVLQLVVSDYILPFVVESIYQPYIEPCLRPCLSCLSSLFGKRTDEDAHNDAHNKIPLSSPGELNENEKKAALLAKELKTSGYYSLLYLKILFGYMLCMFVYNIVKLDFSQSTWQNYTDLYGLMVNSQFLAMTNGLTVFSGNHQSIALNSKRAVDFDTVRIGETVEYVLDNTTPGAFYLEAVVVRKFQITERAPFERTVNKIELRLRQSESSVSELKVFNANEVLMTQLDCKEYFDVKNDLLGQMFQLHLYNFLFYLPVIITHMIPGLVMYCYVMLFIAFCIWVGVGIFGLSVQVLSCGIIFGMQDRYKTNSQFSLLMVRCLLIIVIQTSVNYAALFYEKNNATPQEYISVVSREFYLRSEYNCYFEEVFTSVKQAFVFFNFV